MTAPVTVSLANLERANQARQAIKQRRIAAYLALRATGLTQHRIAARLGVSVSTIEAYAAERKRLRPSPLLDACEAVEGPGYEWRREAQEAL